MAKPLPPFLTPFEFIRVVTNALNLTKQSKYLDDRAHNLTADYRDIKQSIVQFIQEPLEGYLDKERATVIGGCFSYVFAEYLGLVRNTDLDGVTRDGNCQLLAKYFLPKTILRCVALVADQMPGPNPTLLFGANSSAVATVLTWAEGNLPGWNRYYSGLSGDENKNKRDRINRWKSGSELPTLAYIKGIQSWSNGPWPELLDWNHLKAWLLVARAIDWAKKSDNGQDLVDEVRSQLWGAKPTKSYQKAVKEAQILASTKLKPTFPLVAKLQSELKRTKRKGNIDADELGIAIEKLRGQLAEIDGESTTTYWVDLQEARWYALSGDLVSANAFYKKAFEGCLYRSGEAQKVILHEARSVASSLIKPDAVFLKQLRNVAFLLGVDSASSGNDISKTSFEAWEVNAWRGDFRKLFPEDCLFSGVELNLPKAYVGPLIIDTEKKSKFEARYPNQKVKIGETSKKGIQKLTLAIYNKDFEATQKLIENGATVNCLSDSNESPLLMALEMVNKFDHPYEEKDERFFELVSQQPHDPKIVNQITTKRKLLPLILATKSGQPNYVKKLIDLGADVNARGETDNQTALNICLKIISTVKQPDKHWETQIKTEWTDETYEAARRYSNGSLGSNIEEVKANIARLKNDELFLESLRAVGLMYKSRSGTFNLSELRLIASILLKAGADPNAEHKVPLRGHTPLMLATELDEDSIVEQMLIYGGQPDKTYYDHKAKRQPDCWDIAYYHRSKKVCHLLNGIRHHFNKPELPLEDV